MTKVSIIVPFYNVERYIEKCLDSLVNQTLKEIEIILVNDGSKDSSKKIAKKYSEIYKEKIVYLEKQNGGLSDARNYGIPYAKGEYIAFLDSDDYVEKDMYEKMYHLAKKENSDMVECDFYWEYPDKIKKDVGEIYKGKHEMLQKVRVVAWNKLIKRTLLEKTKIEFPKGYNYEDVEFTYKLIPHLNKVSFLKEPCVHYIQRENSIANTQNEKTKNILDVLDHVLCYYKKNDIYNEYKKELEYTYARILLCSSLKRMIKINKKELKTELLNRAWKDLNTKFPNWKQNEIIKKSKKPKDIYLRTVNKFTYKLYCKIIEGMK